MEGEGEKKLLAEALLYASDKRPRHQNTSTRPENQVPCKGAKILEELLENTTVVRLR
jgi:hypothetical protein